MLRYQTTVTQPRVPSSRVTGLQWLLSIRKHRVSCITKRDFGKISLRNASPTADMEGTDVLPVDADDPQLEGSVEHLWIVPAAATPPQSPGLQVSRVQIENCRRRDLTNRRRRDLNNLQRRDWRPFACNRAPRHTGYAGF
jgi:hypothetical protein